MANEALEAWNEAVSARLKWLPYMDSMDKGGEEFERLRAAEVRCKSFGLATPYQIACGGTA